MPSRRDTYLYSTIGTMLAILIALTLLDLLTLARYAGLAYVSFILIFHIYKPWNFTEVGREFYGLAVVAGVLVGVLVALEFLASIQI